MAANPCIFPHEEPNQVGQNFHIFFTSCQFFSTLLKVGHLRQLLVLEALKTARYKQHHLYFAATAVTEKKWFITMTLG